MMTLAAVRALVRGLVQFDPETYVSADADLDALVNRRADAFAVSARAFLSRPTLSLAGQSSPGPLAVDLRPLGVVDPTRVWIDGRPLLDASSGSLAGASAIQDVEALCPRFLATPPGDAAHWWILSPERIEVWPAPASPSQLAVMGTGLHGPLSSSSDATRFPPELDEPFAYDVAAELLRPRASGSTLERVAEFRAVADRAATAYRARSEAATVGRLVRGSRRGQGPVRIGGGR